MLERNRTFGRVSRPVDKASAPRQALERRRKSGRAKHATIVSPKLQAMRFREAKAVSEAVTAAALASEEPAPSVNLAYPAPAIPAPSILPDDAANEPATAAEAAAPIGPNAAGTTETTALLSSAPEIVIEQAWAENAGSSAASVLSVAMDPAARPMPPTPRRAHKPRPVVRLALAASVALACLLTFGRFSDAHLSAPVILSPAAPAASTDATAPVVEALPRVAALTLYPSDAATLPPLLATAASGTDDLVESAALPPSASEWVTARAAASPEKVEVQAGHHAPPRNAAAGKQVAARSAAPRVRREASQREPSRGPIVDFLSNLIP